MRIVSGVQGHGRGHASRATVLLPLLGHHQVLLLIGEWKLDDRRTLLRWKGEIQGHELESLDIIEGNEEGLIVERKIVFRPMPAATLFRDSMRAAVGSSIPDVSWEYSE